MDAVRTWAFSICAAMAASGIALQIMPKSNLSDVFKLVVSMFFLCCLLTPIIVQIPVSYQLAEEDIQLAAQEKADRLQLVAARQMREQASVDIKKNIAEKLKQMGIKHHSITINITTNGQSDAVESVDICLDKSHEPDHDKIAVRLESALQLDVRLEYAEKERSYAGL